MEVKNDKLYWGKVLKKKESCSIIIMIKIVCKNNNKSIKTKEKGRVMKNKSENFVGYITETFKKAKEKNITATKNGILVMSIEDRSTAKELGLEHCFIGGHPMAGSEKSGFQNS